MTATSGTYNGNPRRRYRSVMTVTAHCLGCAWTAGPGDWSVDRQAERHASCGHPTVTVAAAIRDASYQTLSDE